jgi:hypothetical protein
LLSTTKHISTISIHSSKWSSQVKEAIIEPFKIRNGTQGKIFLSYLSFSETIFEVEETFTTLMSTLGGNQHHLPAENNKENCQIDRDSLSQHHVLRAAGAAH